MSQASWNWTYDHSIECNKRLISTHSSHGLETQSYSTWIAEESSSNVRRCSTILQMGNHGFEYGNERWYDTELVLESKQSICVKYK